MSIMINTKNNDYIQNIRLSDDKNSVIILDQTQLPNRTVYLKIDTREEFYDAIFHLKVRGAPAIGIFAGYAIYVLACKYSADCFNNFLLHFRADAEYLNSSRPTAVNLSWALIRMESVVVKNSSKSVKEILMLLENEAYSIHEEDMQMCLKISEYGLTLLKEGDGVLTHCNAGAIATSKYGTALGPLLLAKEKGMNIHVFADETRPLLQGARLTSYELQKAGVDVTLICDNMASSIMKQGWVKACFVGCDRVAANGDVANKIGTSGVAVLAHYYGIPFYVLGPTSTIDLNCKSGLDIKIEMRPSYEIKEKFFTEPAALKEVKCYNPAFDITDNSLISAIITERGICRPPFNISIPSICR